MEPRAEPDAQPPARSAPRVLVVEAAAAARTAIVRTLAVDGCRVAEAASVAEARAQLAKGEPDVVVLELGLPDSGGIELLRTCVDLPVPVVVLTVRGDESELMRGLELGADEYMVKPYFPRELAFRVRRAAERTRPGRTPVLRSGRIAIDTGRREVSVAGVVVGLTDREFDLLAFLASTPGAVHSRDDLLRDVWRSSPDWQTSATVTEHVHRLRRKIEVDPTRPALIVTVGRTGYRFGPDRC